MNREMRVTCLYISSHVLMSKFIVGSVYMRKGSNVGGSKLSSTSTIISLGPQLPPSFFLYFTVFNLYFSYLKIQWILSSGSHYCNSSRNKKKAMLKMNLLPVLNKDSVCLTKIHICMRKSGSQTLLRKVLELTNCRWKTFKKMLHLC